MFRAAVKPIDFTTKIVWLSWNNQWKINWRSMNHLWEFNEKTIKIALKTLENHWKTLKKLFWEALRAPKQREMCPRGSWTGPRGCPGIPSRAQGGKKGAQEAAKNAPRTPRSPLWAPSGTKIRVFLVKTSSKLAENLEILEIENHWKSLKKTMVFQCFSLILEYLRIPGA